MTMITQDQIPTVLEHPVYDTDGNKIGEAKHVFLDDVTRQPEWVSVKTGLFGTSESFVPIADASLVEDHLEVPFPKEKVKDAPNVDVDTAATCPRRKNTACTSTTASTGTPPGNRPTSPPPAGRPAPRMTR
ncbi:PRC-barrel domain-containing protein [Streptomyces sp. NPDC058301]|uniref:PRC-barrel domain-containing protein n=1 Tax=Streptomyces sp. NPDC058301 TaxID=3346436 RepID=UPI0036DFD304